jgi:hypothetical protein
MKMTAFWVVAMYSPVEFRNVSQEFTLNHQGDNAGKKYL